MDISKMTLRQLVIERILYAVSESDLITEFDTHPDEMETMSDLDLFELFEAVLDILHT
jgi:hypothetical protein